MLNIKISRRFVPRGCCLGFCFLAGLPKLRKPSRGSLVVKNLAEQMTGEARYLSADAPRGPVDQLRTPELLEQTGRQQ